MGVLVTIAQKMIAALKNDPFYHFEENYSDRQLAAVLWYRGKQAARGVFVRFRLKRAAGLIFAGRRVVIEHGYQISAEANLILEDDVHINALSANGISFGRNVTVGKGAIIVCTGVVAHKGVGLKIGDHSAIGAQSFIGAQGGITIGNDVIMGPGVRIFSENHMYDRYDLPIRKQGERRNEVVIEDDCWVGSGVTILSGVTVGRGSVIAAGSVVSRDIPPNSIAAGMPLKTISR